MLHICGLYLLRTTQLLEAPPVESLHHAAHASSGGIGFTQMLDELLGPDEALCPPGERGEVFAKHIPGPFVDQVPI